MRENAKRTASLVLGAFLVGTNVALARRLRKKDATIRILEKEKAAAEEDARFVMSMFEKTSRDKDERIRDALDAAYRDGVTGIPNRLAFDSFVEDLGSTPVGLVVCDVDAFKAINDAFGHEVGDEALALVADVLRRSTREGDQAFRVGGDEFCVVAVGADEKAKGAILKRMTTANLTLEREWGRTPKLAVSAGVAFGRADETKRGLFAAADAASYEAKKKRRETDLPDRS